MNPGDIAAHLAVAIATSDSPDGSVTLSLELVEAIVGTLRWLPANADMDEDDRLPRGSCGDRGCLALGDVHDLATWVCREHAREFPHRWAEAQDLIDELATVCHGRNRMAAFLATLAVAAGCAHQGSREVHPEAFSNVDDRPKAGRPTH